MISENGLSLIKRFESLKLTAYKCPAGVWTIGYGHTKNVYEGKKITEKEANELLAQDVFIVESAINKFVNVSINQNQKDALVSFVFNVGSNNFRSSTLLLKINKSDFVGAANEFLRWNKARDKTGKLRELAGLTTRRNAEKLLFEKVENKNAR